MQSRHLMIIPCFQTCDNIILSVIHTLIMKKKKKKKNRYLVSISAGEFSLKQILVETVILPQLGFIATPVHLVSLRDKHRQPILDKTPLMYASSGFKICLPAAMNN